MEKLKEQGQIDLSRATSMLTPSNDSSPSRIAFANTLRGVAALCVVIQHYSYVFWHERGTVASLVNTPGLVSPLLTPSYLRWVGYMQPFELGQFGVGVFFLISGFVIPFSFAKGGRRSFVVGRLTRIYPTYAAGFAFTLAAIWICGSYFGRPFPYDATSVVVHFFPGIQGWAMTPGIDGIIWTLNIEMMFYVVCALMAGAFIRGSATVFLAPLVLTIAAWFLVPVSSAIGGETAARASMIYLTVQFLDLMFIGVVFNYLARRLLSPQTAVTAIAVLSVAMAAIWQRALPIKADYGWSYAAALLAFATAFVFQNSAVFRPKRVTEFFADISYPLYVVHGVIGYVAMRVLLELDWPPGLALAVAFCGVVGLATLLHFAVELPTHRGGKRWASKWQRFGVSVSHGAAALPHIDTAPFKELP